MAKERFIVEIYMDIEEDAPRSDKSKAIDCQTREMSTIYPQHGGNHNRYFTAAAVLMRVMLASAYKEYEDEDEEGDPEWLEFERLLSEGKVPY